MRDTDLDELKLMFDLLDVLRASNLGTERKVRAAELAYDIIKQDAEAQVSAVPLAS
jgi:hypothetical protein